MLTLAIQSGGDSSRMGQDKALMPFLGEPLIKRVVNRLDRLSDDILVTTNHPQDYLFLDLRLIPDLEQGRGALGGLYTALSASEYPLVAVVACDMPFASLQLFEFLRDILLSDDLDAAVPSTHKGIEPLHAVYRRETCLPMVKASLAAGDWKLISWFERGNIRVLTQEEVSPFDPHGLVFWNLNSPREFNLAQKKAREIPDA